MVLAKSVLAVLDSHPALGGLELHQLQQFLELGCRLLPEIQGSMHPTPSSSPPTLASKYQEFLSCSLKLTPEQVTVCWNALFPFIADAGYQTESAPTLDDSDFLKYSVAAHSLTPGPGMSTCRQANCGAKLVHKPSIHSIAFTLRRGALPVLCPSLYCIRCLTRYYHNYSITEASKPDAQRVYYGGIPSWIEVSDHVFVDIEFCKWIETEMTFAQSSSETIARIYLLTHARLPPTDRTTASKITGEMVLHVFFLHSLLQDSKKHGSLLKLPHHGENRVRLSGALAERNLRMAGTGQDMWAHACNLCMKRIAGPNGLQSRITAVVTDGVTLGHPCCGVKDCKIPLSKQYHRYCPEHTSHLTVCAITTCTRNTSGGYATCDTHTHRQWEVDRHTLNKATPRLKQSLSRAKQQSSLAACDDRASESEALASQPGPSLKGRISRTWTHNEQLAIRPCQIVLARAAMFGSEAVNAVKDFLKVTFLPKYPGSLLSYIFYDDNCKLWEHLVASNDTYFLNKVGLVVDVFHFTRKHKETDINCQTYCNPANYPELVGSNGTWVFNSSAAEQVNAWFGGFQAVVREMSPERYGFYLDQMIAIRNQFVVTELERKGHKPHLVPRSVLEGLE